VHLVGVLVLFSYQGLKPNPVYVSHHHLEESVRTLGIFDPNSATVINGRMFHEECRLLEGVLLHPIELFLQIPRRSRSAGLWTGKRVSLEFRQKQIGDFPD
jgi:hypothetical protein